MQHTSRASNFIGAAIIYFSRSKAQAIFPFLLLRVSNLFKDIPASCAPGRMTPHFHAFRKSVIWFWLMIIASATANLNSIKKMTYVVSFSQQSFYRRYVSYWHYRLRFLRALQAVPSLIAISDTSRWRWKYIDDRILMPAHYIAPAIPDALFICRTAHTLFCALWVRLRR